MALKIRYRTLLGFFLAAAVAAASSILPYAEMKTTEEEDFSVAEEDSESFLQDMASAAESDNISGFRSESEDGLDILSGIQGENAAASPFDPEEQEMLPSWDETEAETQTVAENLDAPVNETAAVDLTEGESEMEKSQNGSIETEPEETESEILEGATDDSGTASVFVTVTTEQVNGNYTLYCRYHLQKDGEENWSALDTDQDGLLYRAGTQNTISGLEYGTDYWIKVSVPHYSDSAAHKISISEDGTVYIDGSKTEYLTLSLNVARYMNRNDLTKITLTSLNKISRSAALEGGTATRSFLLSAFLAGTNALNRLVLLNLNDYSLIRTESAKYALEHANDMTYIASEDRVYVMPMDHTNRVIFLNGSTLAFEGERVLSQNYHAVAWDETSSCFFCVYEGPRGIFCDVLNSDMTQLIRSFPIHTNLTYQGAAAYNSMLYYTCWERGATSSYQAVYDGVLNANDNVIYVYDIYGNLCKTYYIEGGSSKSELETLSFVNGRMILQFNEKSNAGYYRVDPIPASVNLSVPVKQNGKPAADSAYAAVLKKDGKTVSNLTCTKGIFTADVRITEPGFYTFTISQKSGASPDKYVYDTDEVEFTVTAVYDPYTNALSISVSGPSRAAITNLKLTKAQQNQIRTLKKQRVTVSKAKGKASALKLKWKKVRFGKGKVSGYMVQICRNKKFRGGTLQTISTGGTSLTIQNLIAGKAYFVRIRACRRVGTKTFYSKWSERKKIRISGSR